MLKPRSHIKADVIILGCSLPGIVTAHKLKKKFGDTVDIVVLDLTGKDPFFASKCNVVFEDTPEETEEISYTGTAKELIEDIGKRYITVYAKEFNIPLPDAIITPAKSRSGLNKVFEYKNGNVAECMRNFHDFDYLNMFERFELNQYQTALDENMKKLFLANRVINPSERKLLLYYDKTTMETHICGALIFANSKDIMRNIVRLVCGVPADGVSVLFYLHQCYRASSARRHIDGDNIKFREKLLGYCRKHLATKLQNSVASITLPAKSIKNISSYSDEQVILKTLKGDINYVCNLLAMAIKPDELHNIEVEAQLLYGKEIDIASAMKKGKCKRFLVQYEDSFWRNYGFSGDILSVRGPVIWATERPRMTSTDSQETYAALIGYLKCKGDDNESSKEAVLKQLVRLFGEEAAEPISYRENNIADVYVPRCGDFIALQNLCEMPKPRHLEWAALDKFADGDVAAALEAGHTAYLHLLSCLRPQAMTYEDVIASEWPTLYNEDLLRKLFAEVSITSTLRIILCAAAAYFGFKLLQSYTRK